MMALLRRLLMLLGLLLEPLEADAEFLQLALVLELQSSPGGRHSLPFQQQRHGSDASFHTLYLPLVLSLTLLGIQPQSTQPFPSRGSGFRDSPLHHLESVAELRPAQLTAPLGPHPVVELPTLCLPASTASRSPGMLGIPSLIAPKAPLHIGS